jgi:hypothetical protein
MSLRYILTDYKNKIKIKLNIQNIQKSINLNYSILVYRLQNLKLNIRPLFLI